MLSEISQSRERQIPCDFTPYVESNEQNALTSKTETDSWIDRPTAVVVGAVLKDRKGRD